MSISFCKLKLMHVTELAICGSNTVAVSVLSVKMLKMWSAVL